MTPGEIVIAVLLLLILLAEKPLGEHVIHGLCATLHKMATGAAPGHAAGEQHG